MSTFRNPTGGHVPEEYRDTLGVARDRRCAVTSGDQAAHRPGVRAGLRQAAAENADEIGMNHCVLDWLCLAKSR